MNKYELTDQILNKAPFLGGMNIPTFESALVRMCIAHVMNGGAFIGLYQTAVQYLKSLERHDLFMKGQDQ